MKWLRSFKTKVRFALGTLTHPVIWYSLLTHNFANFIDFIYWILYNLVLGVVYPKIRRGQIWPFVLTFKPLRRAKIRHLVSVRSLIWLSEAKKWKPLMPHLEFWKYIINNLAASLFLNFTYLNTKTLHYFIVNLKFKIKCLPASWRSIAFSDTDLCFSFACLISIVVKRASFSYLAWEKFSTVWNGVTHRKGFFFEKN